MRFGVREIVFSVLLLAIPVGAWWFVFRPGNLRNAKVCEEIETRQNKLRVLNRATAIIGNLEQEIALLDDSIKFFRSKLPSEKEIDTVLREVWRLAEANNLATKSIRTLKMNDELSVTDPNGPYAEQPISMQLEGPFTGLYRFLLALEAQPRIMRIQTMTLGRPTKAEDGCVLADCTVSVFFERGGKE